MTHHGFNHAQVAGIRAAVDTARRATESAKLESCDVTDLEEVFEGIEQELARPTPNKTSLTLFLNSVARSLKVYGKGKKAARQIDAALRAAGLPADWE